MPTERKSDDQIANEALEALDNEYNKLYKDVIPPIEEASGDSSKITIVTQLSAEVSKIKQKFRSLIPGPYLRKLEVFLTDVENLIDEIRSLRTRTMRSLLPNKNPDKKK